jgi:hypothetical protein
VVHGVHPPQARPAVVQPVHRRRQPVGQEQHEREGHRRGQGGERPVAREQHLPLARQPQQHHGRRAGDADRQLHQRVDQAAGEQPRQIEAPRRPSGRRGRSQALHHPERRRQHAHRDDEPHHTPPHLQTPDGGRSETGGLLRGPRNGTRWGRIVRPARGVGDVDPAARGVYAGPGGARSRGPLPDLGADHTPAADHPRTRPLRGRGGARRRDGAPGPPGRARRRPRLRGQPARHGGGRRVGVVGARRAGPRRLGVGRGPGRAHAPRGHPRPRRPRHRARAHRGRVGRGAGHGAARRRAPGAVGRGRRRGLRLRVRAAVHALPDPADARPVGQRHRVR